jgi:hypothetical protein
MQILTSISTRLSQKELFLFHGIIQAKMAILQVWIAKRSLRFLEWQHINKTGNFLKAVILYMGGLAIEKIEDFWHKS